MYSNGDSDISWEDKSKFVTGVDQFLELYNGQRLLTLRICFCLGNEYAGYVDRYIAKTLYGDDDEEVTPQNSDTGGAKMFRPLPGSNEKILLKNGPYGFYVLVRRYLPKRASVSQGNHPDDGQPVVLKLEKFGFSIRHRHTIAPVPEYSFEYEKYPQQV
ncbi:hypothetical protein LOK49_LG12G02855 [Camellia lanceoleosa]|uniref:Uncharacterized protein n=1 Tax=Camellia lanceoleosa TaxID=1840588 RepID=A0ACC0FVK8_9ERIC|nr:hypothetical protein LOK49_LG12G02855 [Camellia lanceoleosa]